MRDHPVSEHGSSGFLRLTSALLHGDEEETDGGGQQQVHGLVQQFRREDAPYEEMVAQSSHQHDVGCSRHRPQQGQTVAAVAHCNRAPEERRRRRRSRQTGEKGWVTLL